jgi:uncharacterized protein (TIGR04255 family)
MPKPLPTFERPPLDEMAIGVQFDPLRNLRAAHFGLYWSRIRSEYPSTEDQGPLGTIVEQPEIQPATNVITAVPLAVPPLPRCWFLTEDKTQLIQLQRDRFLRNWRQTTGNVRYPHYDRLARDFQGAWAGFLKFAGEEHLGPVNVNQCELLYVDYIEKGAAWDELGELQRLFPMLCPRETGAFLPIPEMLTWQLRYKLPDGRGRLHVEMGPTFRGRDMKVVVGLTFTARGAPAGGAPEQIGAWLDLAHEWINRAFGELTSPSAQELWGKRS